MIELEVDGNKIMTLNDDNTIVISDIKKIDLEGDVVNVNNLPSFVTINDIK